MEEENATMAEDVLYFIADNITTNIRELEGCLTRILAYASISGKTIDTSTAREILGKELLRPRKELTIVFIQKKTAEYFDTDPGMMTAKKKTSHIALARQVAMYLSRKHTSFSLKSIGDAFGGRDHSTVIHACDLIAKKINNDPDFQRKVSELTSIIMA